MSSTISRIVVSTRKTIDGSLGVDSSLAMPIAVRGTRAAASARSRRPAALPSGASDIAVSLTSRSQNANVSPMKQLASRLTNASRRLGEYTRSFGWRAGTRYFVRDQSRHEGRASIVWPTLRHSVEVRLGKPGADLRTFTQVFVAREYDFELQHEPAVIVDAGAHIGCASLWLARRYPNAKIIAIEPDRENFELLERNVDSYPNILALHGALWGRSGNLALIDPGHGSWGYRVTENGASKGMIPAVTIDDLLAKFDLFRIDLLKIDIEG